MLKKEKLKLILSLVITPVLIITMVVIALTMREKALIEEKNSDGTNQEVLNVINHSHSFN